MILALAFEGVVAAALLALGLRGLRGGFEAPDWMDPEDRAARASVRRRGALTCVTIGGLLALATLLGAITSVSR